MDRLFKLDWASMSCSERKYFSQTLHRNNTMHNIPGLEYRYNTQTNMQSLCGKKERKIDYHYHHKYFRRAGCWLFIFIRYQLSFNPKKKNSISLSTLKIKCIHFV